MSEALASRPSDLDDLRVGGGELLAQRLREVAAAPAPGWDPARAADAAAVAADLERTLFANAGRGLHARRRYADALQALIQLLPLQLGPLPADVAGRLALAGALEPERALALALAPPAPPGPREVLRREFARVLQAADARLVAAPGAALGFARELEQACFDAAVRASKSAEEPPRRQWDSPAFLNLYSFRCGSLLLLLDPEAAPCRAFGGALVPRLLATAWGPRPGEEGLDPLRAADLGRLSVAELVPAALAPERAEIARRQAQRVEEKESTLFRCPDCGARRSTYRQVQSRSLDEAPDYRCKCLECGKRFVGHG